MFEWLKQELAMIKTPKFHIVEGPSSPSFQEAITKSNVELPRSYKEFAIEFGNAKLYRDVTHGFYRIGIFAAPREVMLRDDHIRHVIGFFDSASVYVSPEDNNILQIWEVERGRTAALVASNFEEWLKDRCAIARKSYGREKWQEIIRGPAPFGSEELQILSARRRVQWRVIGIDRQQNHVFEVTNASDRILPVLTIGLRSRDGTLNGAIGLKIAHILPGQTAALHVGCYKGIKAASEIEAFDLPDPSPEDREFFQEFRPLH